MKKIPGVVLTALAVILALVLVDTCARRDERAKAEARAQDTRDDSTVSRLVHEAAVAEQRFRRERDSTGRVIANLRSRIAPVTERRDSLIASLLSGRAQDSLQILFWKAHADTLRTVVASLRTARDSWRRAAEKPSYTVTDIGGGAIAGWGIAERNETAVLVGAGVVLVPRLLGAVRRLF